MMRSAIWVFVLAAASTVSAEDYPLDEISRQVPTKGKLRCPESSLVSYKGTHLSYGRAIRVHEHFVPKLEAFEKIVNELSQLYFARTPVRVRHRGTYNCRRIRRYPGWISEHSMGNALDLSGFDFARAKGKKGRFSRSFKIRIEKDWHADNAKGRFLRTLTSVLIESKSFRGVYGPAWPGHKDHLHFDYGNFEMVEVFTGKEPKDKKVRTKARQAVLDEILGRHSAVK